MYRVLTSDGLQQGAIDKLVSAGIEVVNEFYPKEVLGEELKEFDAVVVRSATKITADVLDIASEGKLKLVIRAGVGVDNIDIIHAHKKGIKVKNTPNASSDSVAELALSSYVCSSKILRYIKLYYEKW